MRTIEAGGLVVLIGVVYLVVVLGFGDTPTDETRRVLGLSIVAAAIAALLFVPARNWLEELANRRVYGEQRAPDEPLQTFGARMSRAIPLDELLLQLAESLKKSMQLSNAEVWTGTDGVFERAAAVPYRETARVRLNEEEAQVVTRAHVSGNAWVQVWLPGILAEHPGRTLRVAPLVLSGELFGFIVCARNTDQTPFSSRGGTCAHRPRPPGRGRAAQLRARHRVASVTRRPPHRKRGTPRITRRASSRPPTSRAARSNATCTTARNSTSSRWQ